MLSEYCVYGGRLRSDIPLPELPAADSDTPLNWTLLTDESAADLPPAELIGEDELANAVRVRLFRSSQGYRIEYSDTGTFDVLENGSLIRWRPGARRDDDVIRQDFLGRVMAVALHAAGGMCLHGSAVGINEGAVAFLGPKRAGKSTLAEALVARGATHVSDDIVAIDSGPLPLIRPGVSEIRLWGDSAARVVGSSIERSKTPAGKHLFVPRLRKPGVEIKGRPCRALYLLVPRPHGSAGAAAVRTRISPVPATAYLIGQNKLGRLLATAETGELFVRYGRLAQTVPVYRLEVRRGYVELNDVVSCVNGWHQGGSAP